MDLAGDTVFGCNTKFVSEKLLSNIKSDSVKIEQIDLSMIVPYN